MAKGHESERCASFRRRCSQGPRRDSANRPPARDERRRSPRAGRAQGPAFFAAARGLRRCRGAVAAERRVSSSIPWRLLRAPGPTLRSRWCPPTAPSIVPEEQPAMGTPPCDLKIVLPMRLHAHANTFCDGAARWAMSVMGEPHAGSRFLSYLLLALVGLPRCSAATDDEEPGPPESAGTGATSAPARATRAVVWRGHGRQDAANRAASARAHGNCDDGLALEAANPIDAARAIGLCTMATRTAGASWRLRGCARTGFPFGCAARRQGNH